MKTFPLTETLTGMMLEWNENHNSTRYTIAFSNTFPKTIDPDRLAKAVEDTVAANSIFKTRFTESDEGWRWFTDDSIKITVKRTSLSDSEADKLQKTRCRPFDPMSEPLARFELIETPTTYRLLVEIFHVISDGTSVAAFKNEISARYSALPPPQLKDNFSEYAENEALSFSSPEYAEAKADAIARFSGKHMSIPQSSTTGAARETKSHFFETSVTLPRQSIDSFCIGAFAPAKDSAGNAAPSQIALNLFWMGVFARTLGLYTNEKDVVFWTINHGRGRTGEFRNSPGCFVKTVPVLGDLSKESQSIAEYFKSFKLHRAGTYPFTHFCRDLGMKPGWGFVFQTGTTDYVIMLDSVCGQPHTPMSGGASENPVAQIFATEDGFRIVMTCEPGLYDESFLTEFANRMKVIALNFAAAPCGSMLRDIPVLTAAELEEVVAASYGGTLEYDTAKTFIDHFSEQARLRPNATALVTCDERLTYAELDIASDRLAAALASEGVTPGSFVAIRLPRCADFPISIVATLKCGAGYVPLDPAYPQDRLDYMVANSEAKVVIDESWLAAHGLTAAKRKVDGNAGASRNVRHLNLATPNGPAYMIYTSGSTGRPKGVAVPHRALSNLIAWFRANFALCPGKKNIALPSFCFDASIPDLFAPLASGGELHILDEDMRKDLQSVGEYCIANGITGATAATQMGLALVNTYPELPLEYMMLGGEKMVSFAKTPVRMLNGYGPTEFCVCSSYHEVDQSKSYDIPIGRAVPNTWSLVVDTLGQPVPPGMKGEIALSGIQLADGYWRNPEKTDAAFVPLPSSLNLNSPLFKAENAERAGEGRVTTLMYRTGDIGKYNAGGELEFLGRIDFQVKLRGFRIEIGEIEQTASTFPGIKSVIALVKKIGGTDHLVLYYEDKDSSIDAGELKKHLAKSLTAYMVPDYFVGLAKMPLTPGGKIDRKALPDPQSEDQPVIEPANEQEKAILAAVCSVIGRDGIGVTHDFTDIGLSSLSAMALVVRLKKSIGVKVTLRQLAYNPSVRALAEFLKSPSGAKQSPATAPTPRRPRRASYPMTENQRGIYADWLANPGTTQYNIPLVVKFPATDAALLAAATAQVISAHESFAVQFAEENGEIVQKSVRAEATAIPLKTLDFEPDSDFFTEQMRPFAPSGTPLARAEVFSSPGASYLFLDAHHTIFDGYSVGVFMNELVRVLAGNDPAGESYTSLDAALDERDYLESTLRDEDEKWFAEYLGDLESTRIETSAHGVSTRVGRAGRVRRSIAAEKINAYCRATGITPSDFFLTSFTELLRRVTRTDKVLINFVSAGRSNPDTAETTGMFVKTLPLKGIADAMTFKSAARQIHADVADIIERDRVSFARLAEKFGIRPDILFAFEGGIFKLPDGVELLNPETDTVKAPFSVLVTPSGDSFELKFEYDHSLYSANDMEHLVEMFATLSENAVAIDDLRAIPLVPREEADKLVELSYGGTFEFDKSKTFVDLFIECATAHPEDVAVVDCEHSITYGELNRRSDELAARLASAGLEPGGYAGVMLPRRLEFFIAVIAVQKCGAGYIPIDLEYPADRIDYIIANSGAKVLIDSSYFADAANGAEPAAPRAAFNKATPNSPAYMIYTSGSTGKPKGVAIPHRALSNLLAFSIPLLELTRDDKTTAHPSFSFDASVISMFPTLATGGQLHMFDESIRKDLAGMRDYVVANGITSLGAMSTQIGSALMSTYPDMPVKNVMFGGEKLMPIGKTRAKLMNGYGPTEFCVISSYEIVDPDKDGDIPIGRALPNTYSVVVDRYGHLLPRGFAGELALIGPQIADGYWRLPEKTAAVFVPVPFEIKGAEADSTGELHLSTMYRTGDLARYNSDGKLDYLGRIDFQVKLRGFRIEIGEIECVAKTFPGIGTVAAEVREVGGAKHLVLYYDAAETPDCASGTGKSVIEVEALKEHLRKSLASYMVPDYYVELDAMPITPNGKINRKLLKAPTPRQSTAEYVEPANDAERKIAAAFAKALKCDKYGATDDFFDKGGTSIIAIMAVIAIQKAGIDVQYGDIFKYKTPRALASYFSGAPESAAKTLGMATPPDVYASYDYSATDTLLGATRTDLFNGFVRHSLGDVLLTGATGYLGIHVLKYLLESTSSTVFALVRHKKGVDARRRIDSQYVYYFGTRVPAKFRDRLAFVEGDITDADIADKLAASGIDIGTVINCAALVKHYVADDLMDRINVGGVENLIGLCEKTGARLVHTSTYSVGGTVRADSMVTLDERHLYIGQTSDNDYVRTKFLAERAVLAAIAARRIRAKIMRLGNLMGRESDGEFQMNVGANAFVNSLKTYKALGAYPLEELARPLEMSPIDRVAEAVCLLATTPDDMYIFHPYNRYALDMGAVIAAMNRRGFEIDAVSHDDFAAHVDALRNDPAHAGELQGILHYAGHLLENRKMTPADNTWTTTVLYRLGFRWKPAEDGYLANFFAMLDGLGVFD